MKAAIMEEIEANDLEIYQFPDCDSDEVKKKKRPIGVLFPVLLGWFSIISNLIIIYIIITN
jgi:hypothetical protein